MMNRKELIAMLIQRELDKGRYSDFDTLELEEAAQRFIEEHAPKDTSSAIDFDNDYRDTLWLHQQNGFEVGFNTAMELMKAISD